MNTVMTTRFMAVGVLAGCHLAGPAMSQALTGPEPDVAEPAVEPANEPIVEADPRTAAHDRFLRLNDEQRYEEAAQAARQVVDLTAQEFGPDAMQMVTPLVNLATMQLQVGSLTPAEANYKRSIAIIERHEGRLSARLINPLLGVGAAYNRAGMYQQAVDAFERALRVNHVNEGFYNFDQFKIQDGLTESYVGLQDIGEANFYQEAQVEIYQRKAGAKNPEIAPGLYKLADWYQRSGQIEAAMQTYRQADGLIRKKGGGDSDPARIAGLEGMAKIYERIGNQSASASWLKRTITVINSQTEIDYEQRADIFVRLGDLYIRSGKPTLADEQYSAAWRDLSLNDEYIELRNEYFANPVRVNGRMLSSLKFAPNARGKPADTLSSGYVLISYAVRKNGRANDVQVIESDPPGVMDKVLVSTFARSSFRPRREDGVAVDADRLLYQLDFLYSSQGKKDAPDNDDQPLEYPEPASKPASTGDGRLEYPEKTLD
jgi:tetratricopeptide (TPR) repeat protein